MLYGGVGSVTLLLQFAFVLKRPRHKFSTTTVTHTALHRRLMENITGMFCYSLTTLDSIAQYPDYSLVRRSQLCSSVTSPVLPTCSSVTSPVLPTLIFFFSQLWISCTSSWQPNVRKRLGPEEASPPPHVNAAARTRLPTLAELSSPPLSPSSTDPKSTQQRATASGGRRRFPESCRGQK